MQSDGMHFIGVRPARQCGDAATARWHALCNVFARLCCCSSARVAHTGECVRTTCWFLSPGNALYVAFSDGAASSRRFVAGLGPTTSSGSAAVRCESTTATRSATTAATRVASVNVAAAERRRGGRVSRVRQGRLDSARAALRRPTYLLPTRTPTPRRPPARPCGWACHAVCAAFPGLVASAALGEVRLWCWKR